MTGELAHRHGLRLHAHPHRGPHRHLLWPRRSQSLGSDGADAGRPAESHDHSHGLVADSIKRSRAGVRAVLLALGVLALTAGAQALVLLASGSVALLADLIHNLGGASTAIPLGVAFALRSAAAERWAGLAVVTAIFASACVAGYEAVDRLLDPQEVDALGALAAAGVVGFAGNWVAAAIRTRAGRRLDSPALIADGADARADAYVSLAVVASAGALAVGLKRPTLSSGWPSRSSSCASAGTPGASSAGAIRTDPGAACGVLSRPGRLRRRRETPCFRTTPRVVRPRGRHVYRRRDDLGAGRGLPPGGFTCDQPWSSLRLPEVERDPES